MKHCCQQLDHYRDFVFTLRGKEFFRRVKLSHGPNSWDHQSNVYLGGLRHLLILMNSDQNSIRQGKDNDYGNHDHGWNESTSIVNLTTLLSFVFLLVSRYVWIITSSISLADQSFKSSVETLHDGESQHVDQHVSHAHSCNQSGIIRVSDVVRVNQLNEHIEEHAHDWSYRSLNHQPKLAKQLRRWGQLRYFILTCVNIKL